MAENWSADSEEMEPSWKVQLGVGSDGDLWEAMDLLLERMEGKLEVHWVRGHEDKRTTRRMMSKHQRGNVNTLTVTRITGFAQLSRIFNFYLAGLLHRP